MKCISQSPETVRGASSCRKVAVCVTTTEDCRERISRVNNQRLFSVTTNILIVEDLTDKYKRLLELTVVPTPGRTGLVGGGPLHHVLQTAAVPTALAPDEQPPHHGVADGAPGGGGLAPVAPPGPAVLAEALAAPGAPGVDGGGVLVLRVDRRQGALTEDLTIQIINAKHTNTG